MNSCPGRWDEHSELLSAAWLEVGLSDPRLGAFNETFAVAAPLRAAVRACRAAPTAEHEAAVRSLFTEALPGVRARPCAGAAGLAPVGCPKYPVPGM